MQMVATVISVGKRLGIAGATNCSIEVYTAVKEPLHTFSPIALAGFT